MNARSIDRRGVWTLLACAAAARLLFLLIWPAQAYSADLKDWRIVAAAMLVGINPYVKYQILNWPPMWMEVLFVLSRVCDRLDWSLFTTVRLLLITGDMVLIASLWHLLQLLKSQQRAFFPILWGLCLNPFMILLTIQQGNFDVIPTIFILWFFASLIRFRSGQNPIDWLWAAAWLGLGGFAKTFPLVLAPLLIGQARPLNLKTRLLGAALVLGPAALSLAPLFALNSRPISKFVIFYRGTQGAAGASGLLLDLGGISAVTRYNPIFSAIVFIALALVAIQLWLRPVKNDGNLILLAALILIGLFEFGTGYCPQYWMWPAPLLCIAYIHARAASKLFSPQSQSS